MKHAGPILILALCGALSGCAAVAVGGVATGASVAHDRRTAGTIVEDQAIEFKIYDRIQNDWQFQDRSHVSITSYNRAVLLSGEVDTPQLRELAGQIARGTDQVRQVYNELIVAPPSSLGSRSTDTWITTKVKGSLFGINHLPDFDPTRIKVVTERGVVYLFGLLTTAEAEAVTRVARRVDGVQKVVKLFEYVDRSQTT